MRSIENEKRIVIPRCANIYEIDVPNKKIRFSYSDTRSNGKLNTWRVPLRAREMDFEFQGDKERGYVMIPRFYRNNGNLLKIGNR